MDGVMSWEGKGIDRRRRAAVQLLDEKDGS